MCGIAGIVGPAATAEAVGRMLSRLGHRGPDGEGVWSEPGVAIGHRRLAILDLSDNGRQPMVAPGAVLAANGEIYNFRTLRGELEQAGHAFASRSDSEVLLHGWLAWGERLWPRPHGMFACALWDRRERRLVLARDRLGIKPLYYAEHQGSLYFASEIKAILAVLPGRRRIDWEGFGQYLRFQNTFGPTTLLDGIRMVEPGHVLEWQDGACGLSAFWTPRLQPQPGLGFRQAVTLYREAAQAAVDDHLMSDVQVGAYLSSGIDSSSVATLAARRGRLCAFTGAFGAGDWYDETAGARLVAEAAGLDHRIVKIGPADFTEHFDELVRALDDPRMSMGSFSQFAVAREAARHVKVILTGHGGDEFFSGYPVFKVAALIEALGRAPWAAPRMLARFRPHELPHLGYFLLAALGGRKSHLPVLFDHGRLDGLALPRTRAALADHDPGRGLERLLAGAERAGERLLLTYLRAYLPGLLVVEDKISMAHSLESRTPLLDDRLLDLALAIPDRIKLNGGELKAIPRAAMRGILPEGLYGLPKRGFPTPLSRWFRGELAGWVRQRLDPDHSPLADLFDGARLRQVVTSYLEPSMPAPRVLAELPTQRIWMLLNLDAWLRGLAAEGGAVDPA